MTSRSDCEPLPKPTLSPSFALARPGTFLRVGFFHCRSVVCACSAGTVGSFSNKPLLALSPKKTPTPKSPSPAPLPPSVTLGRGSSLCRCVEHAPFCRVLWFFSTNRLTQKKQRVCPSLLPHVPRALSAWPRGRLSAPSTRCCAALGCSSSSRAVSARFWSMTAYMFAFSCASATFCFCRLSISCLAASLPLPGRAARSLSRASSRSAVSSCTSRSSCLMVCCSWLSWSGAACARKSASPALQTATGAQAGPRGVRAAQAKAHEAGDQSGGQQWRERQSPPRHVRRRQ